MNSRNNYRRLLRNRALKRLLFGEFVSSIGDWLYLVAILVAIYQETRSEVLLGIVGAARIIPYMILSIPAGIVADRYDRRRILLLTNVARGLIMLVLGALVVTGAPAVLLVPLMVLGTCFAVFFGPAMTAFFPTLVEESDLAPANTAYATLDNAALIIGPAIAGVLLASGGLAVAFFLNALSFAVVAVVMWRLPNVHGSPNRNETAGASPTETPESSSGEPSTPGKVLPAPGNTGSSGVRFRDIAPRLVGPLVGDTISSVVGGGLGVLTVVLAVELYGSGEEGTGYLNAAIGVGGFLGSVLLGIVALRRLAYPLVAGSVVGAAALAVVAFAPTLGIAMVGMAVAAVGLLVAGVAETTLIQRVIPREALGRVDGVLETFSTIAFAAGSLLLPLAAGVIGIQTVIVLAGITLALASVLEVALVGRPAFEALEWDEDRLRLVTLPVLAGLPADRLEAVARRGRARRVRPGDPVVREGETADAFYLILDGSFQVTQRDSDGGSRVLRELGRDDVFGEIGLLDRAARSATVTALTPGRLLVVQGSDFLELVASPEPVAARLLGLYRRSGARARP